MPLITKQNQLIEICDLIADKKIAAIDTEFIRETTYKPILCLIQINVDSKSYLIDPLSDLDLSCFFSVLNDEKIIKIFHSSRQDLEVFYQNFSDQVSPKSIFDTQIMAAMCGLGLAISYSAIAKDLLEIEITKEWQRSNWQARPLHDEQLKYAADDVLHLPKIYEILHEKLTKQNKISWAIEEMDSNIQKAITNDDLVRKFSFANKSKNYIENIKLLTLWRDDRARKLNVPRGFILKDDMIEKIAFCNPKTLEELEKYGFKTRMFNADLKAQIIELILSKPFIENGDEYPKLPFRMSEEQKNLYLQSKILLQEKAIEYQISPELIINQSNLSSLVFGYKAIPDILPSWRYEVFGRDLENILKIL